MAQNAWLVTTATGEEVAFPTRAAARAAVRAHPGWIGTGEYAQRIAKGMAAGKTRSEARGHPSWEPKFLRRPEDVKGKLAHRRPGRILIGRPGRDVDMPIEALRRGLRMFRRRFPDEPAVVVAVFGLPAPEQTWQYLSPRLAVRILADLERGTVHPLWGGTVRDVAELEFLADHAATPAEALATIPILSHGSPGWSEIFQVELSPMR